MDEAADAIVDSDDEADYTKMDMGNKKGPINRWDFENDEQYQDYMARKEALPKYAHYLLSPLGSHGVLLCEAVACVCCFLSYC